MLRQSFGLLLLIAASAFAQGTSTPTLEIGLLDESIPNATWEFHEAPVSASSPPSGQQAILKLEGLPAGAWVFPTARLELRNQNPSLLNYVQAPPNAFNLGFLEAHEDVGTPVLDLLESMMVPSATPGIHTMGGTTFNLQGISATQLSAVSSQDMQWRLLYAMQYGGDAIAAFAAESGAGGSMTWPLFTEAWDFYNTVSAGTVLNGTQMYSGQFHAWSNVPAPNTYVIDVMRLYETVVRETAGVVAGQNFLSSEQHLSALSAGVDLSIQFMILLPPTPSSSNNCSWHPLQDLSLVSTPGLCPTGPIDIIVPLPIKISVPLKGPDGPGMPSSYLIAPATTHPVVGGQPAYYLANFSLGQSFNFVWEDSASNEITHLVQRPDPFSQLVLYTTPVGAKRFLRVDPIGVLPSTPTVVTDIEAPREGIVID